jgi:hypothetical protein
MIATSDFMVRAPRRTSGARLADDNVVALSPQSSTPEGGRSPRDPLPLAICLLLWAVFAAAAWGLVALALQIL